MAAQISFDVLSHELKIRIRHTKRSDIPVILFLIVWLTGWSFGEIFALASLLGKNTGLSTRLFFLVWVIPWTIGGAFAIFSILKLLGGFELIEVGRGMVRITRSYIFLKRTRRYDIFGITDMQVLPNDPGKYDFFNKGVLQFRYQQRDIRFGAGLSPEEKHDVLKRLREHRDFSAANFR